MTDGLYGISVTWWTGTWSCDVATSLLNPSRTFRLLLSTLLNKVTFILRNQWQALASSSSPGDIYFSACEGGERGERRRSLMSKHFLFCTSHSIVQSQKVVQLCGGKNPTRQKKKKTRSSSFCHGTFTWDSAPIYVWSVWTFALLCHWVVKIDVCELYNAHILELVLQHMNRSPSLEIILWDMKQSPK